MIHNLDFAKFQAEMWKKEKDVMEWLRKLPPGRYRFIGTIFVAFGLRISEAMAVDFISRLVKKGNR